MKYLTDMFSKDISLTLDIFPPFLMVDKVIKFIPCDSIETIFKVSKDSWFFKSHLRKTPTMPGVLITECMLQSSMLIIYDTKLTFRGKGVVHKFDVKLIEKIDQEITPLELLTKSKLTSSKRGISVFESECYINRTEKKIATSKITHFVPTIPARKKL